LCPRIIKNPPELSSGGFGNSDCLALAAFVKRPQSELKSALGRHCRRMFASKSKTPTGHGFNFSLLG
jgi:hypothetical protein